MVYIEPENTAAEMGAEERRLTSRFNDGMAAGGATNLSISCALVNGAAHIQSAIDKKKKQDAAFDAAMDAILGAMDDLKNQIGQHQNNIRALDDAIDGLRNGEDPEEVANDPQIKKLIAQHERRTGKPVDVNSPDFIEVLTAIKLFENDELIVKQGMLKDIEAIDPKDPEFVEKAQEILKNGNFSKQDGLEAAGNSQNSNITVKVLEASGLTEQGAKRAKTLVSSEDSAPSFMGSSVAMEISGEGNNISDSAITGAYNSAAKHNMPAVELAATVEAQSSPSNLNMHS